MTTKMTTCVMLTHVLTLLVTLPLTFGHLYDILKVDNEPTIGDPVSPDKMFQFMSAGIPQIFWQHVNANPPRHLSSECFKSLTAVSRGFKSNNLHSYKFIDSSGKTPPAFIWSTISSLGHYDQCLDINSYIDDRLLKGKYCAFDMHPIESSNCTHAKRLLDGRCKETDVLSFDQLPVFRGMPFVNALCIPSECSSSEIQQLLSTVVREYGIKVAGDINCDTKESVSLLNRLLSLNKHQMLAGLFIGSLVTAVAASTAAHLFHLFIDSSTFALPPIAESLSAYTTTRSLLWAKSQKPDVIVFETLKVSCILAGIVGHILVCAEIPISYLMLGNHFELNWIFSSPSTQALLNDAGLISVTVLTGIATALIAYPLAKNNKLPFLPAIFDRFLRFLPAMMIMTCLELLWVFSGTGPIFTRVANFVTNKCTKNWWLNFLFINNYIIDSIDICGGSSFYSSVDLQLFIIGLVFIYIFTLSPRAGQVCSVLCILLCWMHTAYNVITHQSTGILFRANPIPIKISEYFDYVHMVTTTYIPGYLLGLNVGYLVTTGALEQLQFKSVKDHIVMLTIAFSFTGAVTLVTTLYNSLQIIPESLAFIVVISNRSTQSMGIACMFIYFTRLIPKTESITSEKEKTNELPKFNLIKAFSRLTFAVYVSNYLVIRTMFFTSRSTISSNLLDSSVRCISTMVLIYIVAAIFHIVLLAPLENIRKYLVEGTKKVKET